MSRIRCKVIELGPPGTGISFGQAIEKKVNEFLALEKDVDKIVSSHFQVIDVGSERLTNLIAFILIYYKVEKDDD